MSLLRVPLILSAATSMHIAVTAPRTATPQERVKPATFLEAFITRVVIASHVLTISLIWGVALGECASILSPYLPLSITQLPFIHLPPPTIPISFIAGSLLVTAAGVIRKLCYVTLGRFFTFELAIQNEHKLVTSGPYAIVRHPSYTGTLLLTIGLFLMYSNNDSWLKTSGMLDFAPLKILVLGWSSLVVVMTVGLFGRAAYEDKLMRDRFGGEWDKWASVVRYRMLPSIY